jgi:filamentous hemagglutinin family protein
MRPRIHPWQQAAAAALAALIAPAPAMANPVGGQVDAGAATFSASGSALTIHQATERAIYQWQDFSIGAGETTRFAQPSSSSVALNRVVGANPSMLLGRLEANGHVILLNPNGIAVGGSATIETSGFIASTLDVDNQAFLSGGSLTFLGPSAASVRNLGTIRAADGDIRLIARSVENSGTLSAPKGVVGLAAGQEVLLQQPGHGSLFVKAPTLPGPGSGVGVANSGLIEAAAAELAASGGNVYALSVKNDGGIRATGAANLGGRVILTAAGGSIQNSGRISARNPDGSGGKVVVDAGRNAAGDATVTHAGAIDVRGEAPGAKGGRAELLGDRVALEGIPSVDASGPAGGGQIRVGGDFHGANPELPNSGAVYVGDGALLSADALEDGEGGTLAVWADGLTRFFGSASARGGALGGNGGFVEVSGRDLLEFEGRVETLAPMGQVGTLLLDPANLAINNSASDVNVNGASPFAPTAASAVLRWSTIKTALAGGAVIVTTVGSPGAQLGNITLAANSPDLASANKLTLDAAGSLLINNNLSNTGAGALDLKGANGIQLKATVTMGGGAVRFFNPVSLTGNGTVDAGAGNVTFDSSVDAAAAGSQSLTVNSGGTTTFLAPVGGTTELASLTTDAAGNTTVRTVKTSGNITFNDDVKLNATYDTRLGNGNFLAAKAATLVGNVLIQTGTGNTTFSGTVDDNAAGTHTLKVDCDGTTTFGAAVGASKALLSLTTVVLGSTTAKGVTTTGDISFNDDVTLDGTYDSSAGNGNFKAGKTATLAGDVTVTTGAGDATFSDTVDGGKNLAVNSGGTTTFGAAAGNTTALASLTTDAAGSTTVRIVKTSGDITFNDDVTLNESCSTSAGNGNFLAAKSTTLANNLAVSTGAGNATFAGAVDGAYKLTVNNSATTSFGAAVGGTTPLASLTTTAPGSTTAKSVTTTGDITFNDDVTLDGTYDSSAGNGNFMAGKTTTLAGAVTITTGSGSVDLAGTVNGAQALAILSGTGAITLGGLVGNTLALASLSLTTSSPLPAQAAAWKAGTLALALGAGNSVALGQAGNDFATLVVNSVKDLALVDAGGIQFGACTIAGNLKLFTTGAIAQGGPLAVSGATCEISANGEGNAASLDYDVTLNDGSLPLGWKVQARNLTLGKALFASLAPLGPVYPASSRYLSATAGGVDQNLSQVLKLQQLISNFVAVFAPSSGFGSLTPEELEAIFDLAMAGETG